MTHKQQRAAQARCDAATPGEWLWRWPSGRNAPHLVHPRKGMLLVMDAVRLGMNAATVRFATRSPVDKGGIMSSAENYMPDASGKRPDYQEPSNHDMAFIAHARADLPLALAEIRRLEAQVEALKEAFSGACRDHEEVSDKLCSEITKLNAMEDEIEKLKEVLYRVQWGSEPGNCPDCGGLKGEAYTHAPDCKLAAALKGAMP